MQSPFVLIEQRPKCTEKNAFGGNGHGDGDGKGDGEGDGSGDGSSCNAIDREDIAREVVRPDGQPTLSQCCNESCRSELPWLQLRA